MDCFSQGNVPCIFQIEQDIAYLTQDQMIVVAYYIKLKKIWDELGSYNNTICYCKANHNRHRLIQFLMGLNNSYNVIWDQILIMNSLFDVAKAYASVVQKEKQYSLGSICEVADNSAIAMHKIESLALASRRGQGSPFCFIPAHRKPLHSSYYDHDHYM